MRYRYEANGEEYEVVIERQAPGYRATVNGVAVDFDLLAVQPGLLSLSISGRPQTLHWASEANQKWISQGGCTYRLGKPSPRRRRGPGGHPEEGSLRAPMPAQVRGVLISPGEEVETGQPLMLLEAMKMEIRLQAPRSARITRILANPGQTVEKDQVLIEMEEPSRSVNQ
jgi:3-methylcrotonyl-CoA carboxylase alpha subunit